MTHTLPSYLHVPLQMMDGLRSKLVEDIDSFVQDIQSNPTRLQVLADAYVEMRDRGDQVLLQERSMDHRGGRDLAGERRAVSHLLVVFMALGERGIEPFVGSRWIEPADPPRADFIPAEVQPFIDLGNQVSRGSGDIAILADLDRVSPSNLARLHGLGNRLSNDPELAADLMRWLQHKPDAVEVELVQSVIGMLEFLGYSW